MDELQQTIEGRQTEMEEKLHSMTNTVDRVAKQVDYGVESFKGEVRDRLGEHEKGLSMVKERMLQEAKEAAEFCTKKTFTELHSQIRTPQLRSARALTWTQATCRSSGDVWRSSVRLWRTRRARSSMSSISRIG